jgi:hypothetical protein
VILAESTLVVVLLAEGDDGFRAGVILAESTLVVVLFGRRRVQEFFQHLVAGYFFAEIYAQ